MALSLRALEDKLTAVDVTFWEYLAWTLNRPDHKIGRAVIAAPWSISGDDMIKRYLNETRGEIPEREKGMRLRQPLVDAEIRAGDKADRVMRKHKLFPSEMLTILLRLGHPVPVEISDEAKLEQTFDRPWVRGYCRTP